MGTVACYEANTVDMKVTSKRPARFYTDSARAFLSDSEDKNGDKRKPVSCLNISGLGTAIDVAVKAAASVEKEGLATIRQIETSYPDMEADNGQHGCARISITLLKG